MKVDSASLTDRPSLTIFRVPDSVCPDRPTRRAKRGGKTIGLLGSEHPVRPTLFCPQRAGRELFLSRFLPLFSDFDPDRPTRSAQRGAIFLGRKLRPTDPLGSDPGRRVHFQLRTPLTAGVMFDLPRWHTQRCPNSRYLYGQRRGLPLSRTTCTASRTPSTILRHRPPVTRF